MLLCTKNFSREWRHTGLRRCDVALLVLRSGAARGALAFVFEQVFLA